MLFSVLCCLSVFVSSTVSVRENHQNFIYDLINKTWTDKVFKLQNHNGTPILLEETADVPRLNRTVRRPNNDKLDIEDGRVIEAPEDIQIDQTENGENKVIEVHSKVQNHNGTPILLEETAEVPTLNRTVRRPNNDKLDIEDGKVIDAPEQTDQSLVDSHKVCEDVQIDQTENGENKVIEVHSKELGNHTITKGAHSISIHSETIW